MSKLFALFVDESSSIVEGENALMNHVIRKTEKSFAVQVCLGCYRALMTTLHYLSSYVGTIMLFVIIKHHFLF